MGKQHNELMQYGAAGDSMFKVHQVVGWLVAAAASAYYVKQVAKADDLIVMLTAAGAAFAMFLINLATSYQVLLYIPIKHLTCPI